MAMQCLICDQFHGHNQELHNDHYQEQIKALWAEIKRLKRRD